MSSHLTSNISQWLQLSAGNGDGLYTLKFAEHHIGNIWIRSLHGGVSGATIEMAAEAETRKALSIDENDQNIAIAITSTSLDYLRITRDVDLFARANIIRLSRRLSIVDVVCWQDDETICVARGTVTLKISRPE